VPSWEEFDAYMHHEARSKWLEPLLQALPSFPEVRDLIAKLGREEAWKHVQRAIRWRLGKFYLSAIRELDLFTRLREMGFPLNYHLLADVLLRVDFWTGKTLVCVFFENTKYRGRKPPAERFFQAFDIVHMKIARQGFGRFWIAADVAVKELAEQVAKSRQ